SLVEKKEKPKKVRKKQKEEICRISRKENASKKVLMCTMCKFGCRCKSTLGAHLRIAHNKTLVQARVSFRCDCGEEVQYSRHTKCTIQSYTIIRHDVAED
ncbi:hypothetical protein PFISCL1PPCAC_21427, partial [Pristionchus fissidentatus]